MLRSAAGRAVIQAGFERVCVSLGQRRGDAPGVPQGAQEAKARRPPVRVLTPSHQSAPSKPPRAPFSLLPQAKPSPDDAPQRGGVRVLPSTTFRLTLSPPRRRPALPGQLDWETRAPSMPKPTWRAGGGGRSGPSLRTRSIPSASRASPSLRTPAQRPGYNGEPGCPGQLQGPKCSLEDRQDAGDPISRYPMPQLSSRLRRRQDRNGSPRSPGSRERQLDPHPAERLGAQR